MAFKDQNGKITIDEVAAQNDIKRIAAAEEHLRVAENYLVQMENLASDFSGKTAESIIQACQTLRSKVALMITKSEYTSTKIKYVLCKYEAIDRELKNLMNSDIGNGGKV